MVEIVEHFSLRIEPVLSVKPFCSTPCLEELLSPHPDAGLQLRVYLLLYHVLKHVLSPVGPAQKSRNEPGPS